MCEDHHPTPLTKYFEALFETGDYKPSGFDRVVRADKIVAQEMFVDSDEERITLRPIPALVMQDAESSNDDISFVEGALVENKSFLPGHGETLPIETAEPFCKASVLVLPNDSTDSQVNYAAPRKA
ncbi:hypothetical protein E8E12_006890 [Didymella heteroderae]|uniref:Uncharacterized protein n=1 Tax=Didymella heteroderae TaxID=1769908 RepID=A0A9P5BZM0_9PLEO|nr:hypothetical protein E8E12_006890 [Didymella heteroderae]